MSTKFQKGWTPGIGWLYHQWPFLPSISGFSFGAISGRMTLVLMLWNYFCTHATPSALVRIL
jgi:hypothetical protein